MSEITEISGDEFEPRVLHPPRAVLVYFQADWCGPCRHLAPILEEVASELHQEITVYKANVVKEADLAQRLGITALPTISLFREGREVARLVGLQNRQRIVEAVRGAS